MSIPTPLRRILHHIYTSTHNKTSLPPCTHFCRRLHCCFYGSKFSFVIPKKLQGSDESVREEQDGRNGFVFSRKSSTEPKTVGSLEKLQHILV